MKRFFLNILFASLLLVGMFLGAYAIGYAVMRGSDSRKSGCIFVWGDSQMYQGMDYEMLGVLLGKRIETSASHGKGVYDFLVSEKQVPRNSQMIVSFSECAMYRNPLSDHDRTGFELGCLHELMQAGCPLENIMRIIGLNRRSIVCSAVFSGERHEMYPYSDTLDCTKEPLDVWPPMFEEKKEWFSWKAKAYEKGLQNLHEKGVRMVLVQLPFETQLESIANGSTNRHLSDSLKWALIKEFDMQYDTIVLKSDSLLMHDLSHLNEVGARLLTLDLADILQKDTINNRFLTVVIE